MNKIAVLCIIVITFCNSGLTSAAGWNYKNQEKWPKQCFDGKEQSPIALSPDISKVVDFEPFEFNGYDEIYPATLHNNGHTVEIRIDTPRKPSVSGGGLGSHYLLEAMHFHWESEHTVEDRRFPLELHLVHYDNRSRDLSQALLTGRVAVLGVLFYVSPDDDSEFTTVFDAIEQLQRLKFNVPHPIRRLELDDFLPRDRAGFYRYKGSLTTPDCTEGITWTVFTNGIPISKRQLEIFTKLVTQDIIPMSSNYRPLQDLNDRKVSLKISDINGAGGPIRTTVQMLMLFAVLIFTM